MNTIFNTANRHFGWRAAVLGALAIGLPSARAQVPQILNYQGRITAEGTNFTGAGRFKFSLVNGTGGATYWSNDTPGAPSGEPNAAVALAVSGGLYSVLLGDTSLAHMAALSSAIFTNNDVRLRVWFDDGTHGSQQLTPDQRIAAAGYALIAASVPDGTITAPKLAPGAVGVTQLPPNVALLDAKQTFLAANTFQSPDNVFVGNGKGLTAISTLQSPGNNPVPVVTVVGPRTVAIGGTRTENPLGASLVVNLVGDNSGGRPGTTAVVYSNPVNGNTWSVGPATDGSFAFSPSGGQNKTVVISDLLAKHLQGDALEIDGRALFTGLSQFKLGATLPNSDPGGKTYRIFSTGASGPGGVGNLVLENSTDGLEALAIDPFGDLGIGTATPANPAVLSRVVDIQGRNGGGSPGTTAVVFSNPSTGNAWSAGTATDGSFHFSSYGNGSQEVVVPILRIAGGADIAEPFDMTDETDARPGMVVSIDPDHAGNLRVSTQAYDPAVAGIISGAGGVHTGMTLSQNDTAANGRHPVALTGRVYCYANAEAGGAIRPGDLLTTSGTPGHAMKAIDRERAGGAVLGKAMTALEHGQGLVLVLVNLR